MLTSDKPRPPSLLPSTRSSTPHPTWATHCSSTATCSIFGSNTAPSSRDGTSPVPRSFRRCARGMPITFVGGNHDRWGGDFLIKDLGIAFHAGEAGLDLAGRRGFVAHGA